MYNYNPFFWGFLRPPFIPADYDIPPTIYTLLNSYVNYNKTDKTKITDLAKEGRGLFFDFDYTLSDKLTKEKFETMILNHYMMSRIGQDTVTAFKIHLNVKINSVLPMLNKLFDALPDLDIFAGEKIETTSLDSREITGERNISDDRNINDEGTTTSESSNINDNRFSDSPQNKLQEVQDGSYVTNYTYNTENLNNEINENVSRNETYERTDNENKNDTNNHHEIITKTRPDEIESFKLYQTELTSIYDMLFKELDDLFYGIV